ncbi:nucleoside-binding outer membrane protein [Methylophaga frappieri]|uniref:Nucleoside-binding outer membrane protein n=2 Tax=Methylophaga frappieri (strain ATCC BAA-2434 / DSM 25690 / JAM7) TaxID=754477 RepID=I1YF08_METFJ|nr:nucleoside-binding outer membrane protein [Methylophaga frappieri]
MSPGRVMALDWSVTELQWQRGALKSPGFAGGVKSQTDILTLQHASGWQYGEHFFFADYLNDDRDDGFNDNDLYLEYYGALSLSKMSGRDLTLGWLKDVSIIGGINYAREAKVLKYLPGLRFSWRLPGFHFFNTDITAYIDDSKGLRNGGAPKESDSYMIDVNWGVPFTLGQQRFSFEGHIEYIGSRHDEFGSPVRHWILAQPQFRWDMGYALFNRQDVLFAGIEYQWWQNKLGDDSDERAVQGLVVWRF